MRILNIPVTAAQLASWRARLAPAAQPFFLTAPEADALALPTLPRTSLTVTPEDRDTLTLWRVDPQADRVVTLTTAEFAALPGRTRQALLRAQVRHGRGNVPLGRHHQDLNPAVPAGRFLWHPDHLTPAVLARVISQGSAPCQREHVPASVWAEAVTALPRVKALAGTFPAGPGNCFGAVMGAAGLTGAEDEWMQRAPFEAFLHARTRPGGTDEQPGTLLVWRNRAGQAEHAAVTLGGGWAFHKPAQTWWTPRVVLPTAALIRNCRTPGQRLERRTLLSPAAG